MGERDPHYRTSEPLVRLVESGQKRAVVSYLLIMETAYVLRKRSVQYSDDNDAESLTNAALKASIRFYDYMVKGLGTGKLIMVRSDGKPCHDSKIFHKSSSVVGPTQSKNYREMGHSDVEHAYLADYGGALEFHTADLAFSALKDDPDFSVKFVVHGGARQT